MHKGYLKTAAFLGALSVAMGAFGAHALKAMVTAESLNVYETAIRYQFYHVFALALTAILFKAYPNKWLKAGGQLFILGIIFFCGSLYLLTYGSATGRSLNWAGPITPLGGLFFISGWVCMAFGVRRTGL